MIRHDKPQVAIITRTKNRPTFLERCIHTVLTQSYQEWVHVIVNDGGDPFAVDEIVKKNIKDYRHRIMVIHNEQSLGMEAASNIGIRNSDSKYIVILDDDDTWHADFLDKCLTCLEKKRHSNIAGVVTHSSRVLEKVEQRRGADVIVEVCREPFNQYLKNISIIELAGDNIFTVNAFVFEREALETVGLFREDLPVLGDWDFNLRFILQYEIEVIPSTLSYFHHRAQINKVESANSVVKNIDDHHFFRTFIQNEQVRKDIKSSQVGVSSIMLAHYHSKNLQSKLNSLENRFLFFRLLRWFKRNIFGS
jgi:glycosyltransferase involved in cell wall biosynthesis